MTKESTVELQKIDCNCNDCWFLVRDIEKFKEAKEQSGIYSFKAFELAKKIKIEAAKYWEEKADFTKAKALFIEAGRIKLKDFHTKQIIQYGDCHKFNKPVSFIPNTCQLETQECFEHRREN